MSTDDMFTLAGVMSTDDMFTLAGAVLLLAIFLAAMVVSNAAKPISDSWSRFRGIGKMKEPQENVVVLDNYRIMRAVDRILAAEKAKQQ